MIQDGWIIDHASTNQVINIIPFKQEEKYKSLRGNLGITVQLNFSTTIQNQNSASILLRIGNGFKLPSINLEY